MYTISSFHPLLSNSFNKINQNSLQLGGGWQRQLRNRIHCRRLQSNDESLGHPKLLTNCVERKLTDRLTLFDGQFNQSSIQSSVITCSFCISYVPSPPSTHLLHSLLIFVIRKDVLSITVISPVLINFFCKKQLQT